MIFTVDSITVSPAVFRHVTRAADDPPATAQAKIHYPNAAKRACHMHNGRRTHHLRHAHRLPLPLRLSASDLGLGPILENLPAVENADHGVAADVFAEFAEDDRSHLTGAQSSDVERFRALEFLWRPDHSWPPFPRIIPLLLRTRLRLRLIPRRLRLPYFSRLDGNTRVSIRTQLPGAPSEPEHRLPILRP